MAPKTQGTLSFSAAKRTASTNIAGKPKASSTTASKAAPTQRESIVISDDDDDDDKDVDLPQERSDAESSDADSDAELPPSANIKAQPRSTQKKGTDVTTAGTSTRPATRSTTGKSPAKTAKPAAEVEEVEISTPKSVAKPKTTVFGQSTGNATPENVAKKVKENLAAATSVGTAPKPAELDPKSPKWRKAANEARAKRGYVPAIHSEDQNQVLDILRVFDNDYDFGPCVGISRWDRWNRAQALGLNPPPEVGEILKTRQGMEDEQYSQPVFYGKV